MSLGQILPQSYTISYAKENISIMSSIYNIAQMYYEQKKSIITNKKRRKGANQICNILLLLKWQFLTIKNMTVETIVFYS